MLGVICLKNRFTELYLCSLAIITMGFFEIFFDYTKANISRRIFIWVYLKLFVGIMFLVFAYNFSH